MNQKEREILKIVVYGVLIFTICGFTIQGLLYAGWETAPKWHDLGTVTAYQDHNSLVWDDNSGAYQHQTWTTANITTMSHGVIHVDSRDICPLSGLVLCASRQVTAWHLNQTVGVVYKNGGWYEVQDP